MTRRNREVPGFIIAFGLGTRLPTIRVYNRGEGWIAWYVFCSDIHHCRMPICCRHEANVRGWHPEHGFTEVNEWD